MPKRDKLGIYLKIENTTLDAAQLIITASLESRHTKTSYLNAARIKIELLKRLFRITNELSVIPSSKYIEMESDLQEISKMTNGWIKYLTAAH